MNKKQNLVNVRAGQPATRNKAQARFDRLIREIGQLRERLAQWQSFQVTCQNRILTELNPLQAAWNARRRDMVMLVDELLTVPQAGRPLGRVQRAKLEQFLLSLARGLLAEPDAASDTALIAVFDRYSDVTHAEIARNELQFTRSMLDEVFGVDVGDDPDITSAQALMDRAEGEMAERLAREALEREQAQAERQAAAPMSKKAQAAQEVSQSLREVYRKLVSSLHPDRETDPAEHARKTALIQRVNQAYDARDLLTLLTLQIEIEQISAADLGAVPDQRVAHYNAVLTEQRDQLRAEVQDHVFQFQHLVDPEVFRGELTPAVVDECLTDDIARVRFQLEVINEDFEGFRHRKYLAEWLKSYELEPEEDAFDDLDLLDSLMDTLDDLAREVPANPKPARRGRKP